MAWWMAALLWIGTTIAGRLFRHKPKREVPHPGTWDSEQMPMISESSSIPVIWGTVRLEAPNVLWFGAPATWNKYEGPTLIAVRYYLTLQYGLCIGPIDRVEAIEWDGLRPDVAARVDGQFYDQIFYRQMNLFGGDLQAGGIYAEIRAYKGLADQPSDSHLEAKVGATLPGYPHLAYLVVRNNPYPHSEEDPCILVRTLPGWTCPCLDFDLGIGRTSKNRSASGRRSGGCVFPG